MTTTRRDIMAGVASVAIGAAIPVGVRRAGARDAKSTGAGTCSVALDIAERPTALPCFGGKTLPLWTFQDSADFPVVRLKQGDRFEARIKNSLTRPGEHATIHWHGLRIPNGEDGVPYLTQAPIQPGEEGRYAFTPPDTGTFFFHTHCNSAEHFGRGLIAAMIVEGDEIAKSDADLVLMMKDWRLAPDGSFLPFSTDDGAAKAGTSGTVRSINGITKPVLKVPSSANVRVRLLNVDSTRISEIGIEGAEAAIIAVDGNVCKPIALGSWRMGPAQRIDILLRSAASGGVVRLVDYFSAQPVVLAEFASEGKALRREKFTATPLRPGRYPPADQARAERLSFDFGATATGASIAALPAGDGLQIGTLCLSKRTFWAINKQAWPNMELMLLGPPLASMKSGQSYIFELKNLTPHAHPIHIHGHTYEILTSNLRKLPPHRADTILLLPKERIEVAVVAGSPGKWMFHCHILEHQESGMMGYLAVT